MKRFFIITALILTHYIGISQTVPMWTKKLPNPSNNDFYYYSITGLGNNYNEAFNDAYNKLHRVIDEKLGTTIIGKSSMDNQGSVSYYAVDGQTHTIKTFKICEWPKPYEKSDHWEFLFQVAKAGNIDVYFDNFNDCYNMVEDHSEDWRALGLSVFPGLGQIIVKKNKPVGYAFMIGDLALVGGGVYCLLESNNQYDISQNPNYTSNYRQDAYDNYKMMDTSSKILFGAAAAVYVINLYTAYKMPKKTNGFALVPKLIPENDNLAFGVGISYSF